MRELENVFANYTGCRQEMIPILQDVQEQQGYISPAAVTAVARFLGIAESAVHGVVTFYTQFYQTRQGHHKIRVCQGTACHVKGCQRILETITRHLGIEAGETTEDYHFTVERVACFGSCALGPVMVVNDDVHGRVTPEQVTRVLGDLQADV